MAEKEIEMKSIKKEWNDLDRSSKVLFALIMLLLLVSIVANILDARKDALIKEKAEQELLYKTIEVIDEDERVSHLFVNDVDVKYDVIVYGTLYVDTEDYVCFFTFTQDSVDVTCIDGPSWKIINPKVRNTFMNKDIFVRIKSVDTSKNLP